MKQLIIILLFSFVISGCFQNSDSTGFLDSNKDKQNTNINGNLPISNDDTTNPINLENNDTTVSQSPDKVEILIDAGDGAIVKLKGNGTSNYPELSLKIEPFSLTNSSMATVVRSNQILGNIPELNAISNRFTISFSNGAKLTGKTSLTIKYDPSKIETTQGLLFCYWDGNNMNVLPYISNEFNNTLTVKFNEKSSSQSPRRSFSPMGSFDNIKFLSGNYQLFTYSNSVKSNYIETVYSKNNNDYLNENEGSTSKCLIINDLINDNEPTSIINFMKEYYDIIGVLKYSYSSSYSVISDDLKQKIFEISDFRSDIISIGTGSFIARDLIEQKSMNTYIPKHIMISPPNGGIDIDKFINYFKTKTNIDISLMKGNFDILPSLLKESVATKQQSYPYFSYINSYIPMLNSNIYGGSFITEYYILTGWSENSGLDKNNGYITLLSSDMKNYSNYQPDKYIFKTFPDTAFSNSPNPDASFNKLINEFQYNMAGSYCKNEIYSDDTSENNVPVCSYASGSGESQNILISFNVTDKDNDSCSLKFSYYTPLTGWVDSDKISNKDKKYTSGSHNFYWYSANDVTNRATEVKIKVQLDDGFGGITSKESTTFNIDNTNLSNKAPSISISKITGRNRDITIEYNLSDLNGDNISIDLEYSKDDGLNYTKTDWIEPELNSIYPSGTLEVKWKSEYDIINSYSNIVKIRMRGFDGKIYSTYAESETFPVNNISDGSNDAPLIAIEPVASGSNTISIYYSLDDPDSNACSLEFQYSADDNDPFHNVNSSDISQNITYIVNGTHILLSWQSENNISTRKDNIRVRLRAFDGQEYSDWNTSNYFIIDN